MLWHNGKITALHDLQFNPADRGLLLGDGLFETLPSFNGVPYLLDAHLKRMATDAECLHFPDRISIVEQAVCMLAAADVSPGAIRVTMTRGAGPRGLAIPPHSEPLVFATRAVWSPDNAFTETRLATSTIRRNGTSPVATMKTLAYLDNVLAMAEARAKNADDALMLTFDGYVASTSMANIFVVLGNTIATSRRADAILPGIMRNQILEFAPSLGFECEERALHPDDVLRADLVFVTNSLRLLTRVSSLDDIALQNRAPEFWNILQSQVENHISQKCNGFLFRQKTC